MEQNVVITIPPDASPELVEQFAESFPDARIETPPPPTVEYGPTIDEALAEVVTAAPGLPQAVAEWWAALPLGGWGALLLILAAIAVGYAGERAVAAILPRPSPGDPEADFRARLPKGLLYMLRGAARLGAFVVVGTLTYRAIAPADRELADLARHVLHIIVMTRSFMLLIEALTAPGQRWRRLMGFDEDGAAKTRREGLIMIAVLLPALVIREFVDSAVGAAASAASLRLVTILIAGIVLARFFLRIADPVRRVLTRRFEGVVQMPGWSSWPAQHWAWIYVVAVVIDMLMKAVGVLGLLGPAAARGSGTAIIILVLAPLCVAGLSVWNREASERAAGKAAAAAPRWASSPWPKAP